MNFSLLSNNLLIIFCALYSVLTFYITFELVNNIPYIKGMRTKHKQLIKRNHIIQFGIVLLASLLAAYLLDLMVTYSTDSPLPKSFILMCLPFTLIVCLFIWNLIFIKKHRLLAGLVIIVGFLFSLILINNYYRYYPSFYSVFGITDAQELNPDLNTVTVKYTINTNQSTINSESVEGALSKINNSQDTDGKIYYINIPGTISKFKARTGYVYVPAVYNSPANVSLPVLVLTEGEPGTPQDWLSLGLQNIMDQFAKQHNGITPLIFVVDDTGVFNNDTECVNSPRGNVETYLTEDVPNYIKHNFRVDESPKNWAIGGLSMGGTCSIMLTLLHPNVYNYFIDLGGELGPSVGSQQQTMAALFNGSEKQWLSHQPIYLLQKYKFPELGGFFGDGSQDFRPITTAITQLSSASKKAGINTVTQFINGEHTFNVWAETYKLALPWISNRIGATECDNSCL